MGEGITGFVSANSGSTSLVITVKGKISPECLEILKKLIKDWAKHCGLIISSVTSSGGAAKKKKSKKKKGKKKA